MWARVENEHRRRCQSISPPVLHGSGRDEDIDPGEERGDCPLSQQLHLHIYQEVFGLADLFLQVYGAREAVHLSGAEVALLVAFGDADDDVVAGVSRGRSDPEDLGGDDDVGLEAELVVRDADGGLLAVGGSTGADVPLAAGVRHLLVVVRAVKGEASETSLEVIAGLSE